jgi:hypothetical protein
MPKDWEVIDARDGWVEYHDEDGVVIRNYQNSQELHENRMKELGDV